MDFVSSDTYDCSIQHSFIIYNFIYMFAHLSNELKPISKSNDCFLSPLLLTERFCYLQRMGEKFS